MHQLYVTDPFLYLHLFVSVPLHFKLSFLFLFFQVWHQSFSVRPLFLSHFSPWLLLGFPPSLSLCFSLWCALCQSRTKEFQPFDFYFPKWSLCNDIGMAFFPSFFNRTNFIRVVLAGQECVNWDWPRARLSLSGREIMKPFHISISLIKSLTLRWMKHTHTHTHTHTHINTDMVQTHACTNCHGNTDSLCSHGCGLTVSQRTDLISGSLPNYVKHQINKNMISRRDSQRVCRATWFRVHLRALKINLLHLTAWFIDTKTEYLTKCFVVRNNLLYAISFKLK